LGIAWTPAQRWGFAAILGIAAALRAWAALATGPVHPDEILQYLEQAHRLLFGYGVVTWEYRYGMRSWLLPLLLSAPMQLGVWAYPDSNLYLHLPRLSAAAVSLLVVVAAFHLGDRLSRVHAFVAMAVAAAWYDIAYFGGHVLTEPLATALILPAAAILIAPSPSRRRLILAGLLLGLAGILRFHYLPAIGVLVVLSCGVNWRGRWLPLIAGGLAAAAIGGAVDLAMGQAPFGWIVTNFVQNVVASRADGFGLEPPLAYLSWLGSVWGAALTAIVLLLVPVLRPYRALIAAAAVNLALHSLIGHKEYRFIFLSIAILVVVAAIGSAELVCRLRSRMPRTGRIAVLALIPAWLATSAALAAGGPLQEQWRAFHAGSSAMTALRSHPGLCGVGVVSLNIWDAGGYTYLRRRVPVYASAMPALTAAEPPLAAIAPSFNSALLPEYRAAELPPGYRPLACSAPEPGIDPERMERPVRICAYVRAGGCNAAAGAAQELHSVLKRHDR
jgi:hypothetical protein